MLAESALNSSVCSVKWPERGRSIIGMTIVQLHNKNVAGIGFSLLEATHIFYTSDETNVVCILLVHECVCVCV